jgi:hypothetical protein
VKNFNRRIIRTLRPDGSAREREIWVPSPHEEEEQRELLEKLHGMGFFFRHAVGAIPGKSLHDNIGPHRQSDQFYLLDLRDAYANTPVRELMQRLDSKDPATDWEKMLIKHALHPEGRGLMMGASISPYLFNIALLGLDADIVRAMDDSWRSHGRKYTRWVDDITISSPGTLTKFHRSIIREAIAEHGMSINHNKTRIHWLDKPVTITGISLYPNRFYQMAPRLVERVIELLNYVEQGLEVQDGRPEINSTGIATAADEVQGKSLVGVLHGAKGIILSTRDPSRSHNTRIEQKLLSRYHQLRLKAGSLGLL